jgi:hypothetical protein
MDGVLVCAVSRVVVNDDAAHRHLRAEAERRRRIVGGSQAQA